MTNFLNINQIVLNKFSSLFNHVALTNLTTTQQDVLYRSHEKCKFIVNQYLKHLQKSGSVDGGDPISLGEEELKFYAKCFPGLPLEFIKAAMEGRIDDVLAIADPLTKLQFLALLVALGYSLPENMSEEELRELRRAALLYAARCWNWDLFKLLAGTENLLVAFAIAAGYGKTEVMQYLLSKHPLMAYLAFSPLLRNHHLHQQRARTFLYKYGNKVACESFDNNLDDIPQPSKRFSLARSVYR